MVATIVAILTVGLLYWFPIRRWFCRWGSSEVDLAREMPGDITNATYSATLAVTINSSPGHIWPWLVQIGYRRGGLYSYDWLDRLFGYLDAPSANRILPEFQRLTAGDEIPIGRGGWFPVKAVDANRTLVLGGEGDGFAWVWQFGLYPIAERRTRLVSRNSVRVPRTVGARLFMRVIEPAALVMTRRMLLGLKKRAETLASSEGTRSMHAA